MKKFTIIIFFLFFISFGFCQQGIPYIRTYLPKEYNGHSQIFSICQDKRGVMYFANLPGITEFDGRHWRFIKVTDNYVTVRCLARDKDGKIFVGTENDFGFLAPDAKGKMQFQSLLNLVDTSKINVGMVWTVGCANNKVYFGTFDGIFEYDYKSINFIQPEGKLHLTFTTKTNVYTVLSGKGLMKLKNGKLELLPDGEKISSGLSSIIDIGKDSLLIASARKLWIFNGKTIEPFKTDAEKFFTDNLLYRVIKFNDTIFYASTLKGGIVVFDLKGRVRLILNKKIGLQSDMILCSYLDQSNVLWIGTDNGFCKIELNNPISEFDARNGLEGTVNNLIVFKNDIYAATEVGVYKLIKQNNGEIDYFKPIENINYQSFDFCIFKEKLLLAAGNGIFEITGTKASLINAKMAPAGTLYASKKFSDLIYIGKLNGLGVLKYQNGQWNEVGNIENINQDIRTIAETEAGNLWLGTFAQGLIYVDFEGNFSLKPKITVYNEKNGLPKDWYQVCEINKKILFGTNDGLYQFNPYRNIFERDTSFSADLARNGSAIVRTSIDNKGRLVVISRGNVAINMPDNKGVYYLYKKPFLRNIKGEFYGLCIDSTGHYWAGGPDGIICFNPSIYKNFEQPFLSLIRYVFVQKDTLFHGTFFDKQQHIATNQTEIFKPVIEFNDNFITFIYSACNYEPESAVKYQYMLEGKDTAWSDWTEETKVYYMNLFEGKYKFKVRAKNIYDHISETAEFEFTILPPWYRTVWAYIAYAILAVLIVWCIVIIATWRIKRLNIAYGRYLPGSFLKMLGRMRVIDFRLGDMAEKEVTIMFSDIRSYTSLSESMTPDENFRFLIKYLKLIGEELHKNTGFPVQYYGDGIMAMFYGDTDDALQAAIDMHKAVEKYSIERKEKNRNPIHIGIGLHTGKIILGIRGDKYRWEGGIVGDNVNLTARIEGLTKIYGASTIFSHDLYVKTKNINKFKVRFLGKVKVKGKENPVGIYELLDGLPYEEFMLKAQTLELFNKAMEHYFKKDIKTASEIFNKVISINPNDIAAKHYAEICNQLLKNGIPETWDGVERLDVK